MKSRSYEVCGRLSGGRMAMDKKTNTTDQRSEGAAPSVDDDTLGLDMAPAPEVLQQAAKREATGANPFTTKPVGVPKTLGA